MSTEYVIQSRQMWTWRLVAIMACLAQMAWPQDTSSKIAQLVRTGRFPVSNPNMEILLSATFAADGRWAELEQSAETGRAHVLESFRLAGLPKQAVEYSLRNICRQSQMFLMAQHNGTFDEIEKLPPFSRFAQANLRRLAAAYAMSGEDGVASEWSQIFKPGWEANRPPAAVPKVEGGPGDTRETAIRITNAMDDNEGIATEYCYIAYVLGRTNKEWTRSKQSLTNPDEKGRRFDVLEINVTSGGQKTFYFDITDFMGR